MSPPLQVELATLSITYPGDLPPVRNAAMTAARVRRLTLTNFHSYRAASIALGMMLVVGKCR